MTGGAHGVRPDAEPDRGHHLAAAHQTLLLLVLAAIAAAAAAAAPGYVVASEQSLAVASAADATAADRVVTAGRPPVSPSLGADLAALTDRVGDTLGLPGSTAIAGASMVAVVTGQIQTLAYRDDVCAHLSIEGTCPRTPGEVLVPAGSAIGQQVQVGDSFGCAGARRSRRSR